MSRGSVPSVLVLLGAVALTPLTATAEPPDQPRAASPDRASRAPHGDRNHDGVDDGFEQRLRSTPADTQVDVIVTGVKSRLAERAVGPFSVRRQLPLIDGFSATLTAGQARSLARRPDVRRVEAVTTVHTLDDGTNRDFGVTGAWADRPGLDGDGVGICVVDTGVDPGHEQIQPRSVVFKDFVGTGTTPYDNHGHGTHVASIAAGDGTGGANAATFAGVAPGADLYVAKVLNAQGSGTNDQVVGGVQWCAGQPGVRVISMSLGDDAGGDGTDALSLAVNAAVEGGVVVVVAAGNSGDQPGTISAPGTATGAITVGAVSEYSNPTGTDRHDDGIWLAPFSGRGPTVDGRSKPDLAAPGVSVRAADAGTLAGYVTYSGTSMATPYVAGAVALALELTPSATPEQIRAALTATAEDVGAPGQDNEWGAGLIDVRAFVDAVAGAASPRRTDYPLGQRSTGVVPTNGYVDVPIQVSADGLGVPLAATVTLAGHAVCYWGCLIVEWSPDLDVELRGPSGTVLATSECALEGLWCGIGRQETVAIRPTVAGTYVLRIRAFTGSPNNGAGGAFVADIFHGPAGAVAPPPPTNTAPVANAGPDQTVTANSKTGRGRFTLDGSQSSDPDGDPLTYKWTRPNGTVVGTTAQVILKRAVGTWTFRLTVSDGRGGSATDSVVVVVHS